MDVAPTVVALVRTTTGILQNIWDSFDTASVSVSIRRQGDLQILKLRLGFVIGKCDAWIDKWGGRKDFRQNSHGQNIHETSLWGSGGFEALQQLMGPILHQCKQMQSIKFEDKRRSRLTRALEPIKKYRQGADIQDFEHRIRVLDDLVEQLSISSGLIFDSLHGSPLTDPKLVEEQESLIQSVLRSRAGTMKLHQLCAKDLRNGDIEMDLSDPSQSSKGTSHTAVKDTIYYHLMTESPTEMIKVVVEHPMSPDCLEEMELEATRTGESNLQPSTPLPYGRTIKVPQDSSSATFLRISEPHGKPSHMTTTPKTLEEILKPMKTTGLPNAVELSKAAKIELAFNVTHCAAYLLGTPWFSCLNTFNLRQLDEKFFMLRFPTYNPSELTSEDETALTEAAQLFRLGRLLVQIALGTETDQVSQAIDESPWLCKLALVQRSMGYQYSRAAAFCLQYRKPEFCDEAKYDSKAQGWWKGYSEKWKTYSIGILEDYYVQVILR
ncbi:MAG: hypothetical protein Q9219_001571 [cf. Caloplaca sp. 3 TL-2023]